MLIILFLLLLYTLLVLYLFCLASEGPAPAASLFQEEYFSLLNDALRDGGITCSQGISPSSISHSFPLSPCVFLYPPPLSPYLSLPLPSPYVSLSLVLSPYLSVSYSV